MGVTLEESTTENIPPILESIVKNVTSQSKTSDSIQKDFLLILLIVAMIENGFVPLDEESEVLDLNSIDSEQINKWKSQVGVYEVPLIMTGFKSTPVTLIMSPLGAMALVNVTIKDFEAETYTVCLPMSKYVAAPQATTIPMIFRDLKHFSLCFKNKVLSAVKSRILDSYGYASASLVGLPEELLFKILIYVPIGGVVNVSKTCMRLRDLLQSNRFWHDVLKRDFDLPKNLSSTGDDDWRCLYIKSYIVQKDAELINQRAAAGSMHDYMDYSDYVSYIDNPMWNVLL